MAWEQVSNAIKFYAFFTASKTGKSGLTPTVYLVRNGTAIVTAGSAAEVDATNLPGLYSYELAGASVTVEGEYIAVFRTADATVDAQHIPSLWIVGKAGVENLDATISSRNATTPPTAAANATAVRSELATELARVDAAVSTRLASASYSAAPTAAANADAVWDELIAGHAVTGSTGAALSAAGGAGDPLTNPVPGTYATGSAGAALGRIGNNVVTVVSPVSTDGDISLKYGDDYYTTDAQSLSFSGTNWPVITGGTVSLRVQGSIGVVAITGTVTSGSACTVEVTQANTYSIGVGVWDYDLEAVLTNSHVKTLQSGLCTVAQDVR